jgi:DnaK suppressor protein
MSKAAQIHTKVRGAYMDHAMQQIFRGILTKIKVDTVAVLQKHAEEETDCQNMADEIDLASMREGVAMSMRRCERASDVLKNVMASLDRIENGEYGYCEDCGGEIGEARLIAQPTAHLCISCKEIAEKSESRYAASKARRSNHNTQIQPR